MQNSESEMFKTKVDQWKQLVGTAEDLLKDARKPWPSATSAADHFVKHGDEFTPGQTFTVDGLCSKSPAKNAFDHG